ncbi:MULTISPECIES: hypothetical protein [Mycolicibacterium]|uniref:hypothetical protein n=1 Tax=Mycolicibacterium TaxID=1866885 RepID=UPI002269EA41|nr:MULTISPECIES: hypothetical protein [Mycolicibacterium]
MTAERCIAVGECWYVIDARRHADATLLELPSPRRVWPADSCFIRRGWSHG